MAKRFLADTNYGISKRTEETNDLLEEMVEAQKQTNLLLERLIDVLKVVSIR